MKNIVVIIIAILTLSMLCISCFAQETDLGPVIDGEMQDDQEDAGGENTASDEVYAQHKTITEMVQDYCLEHWDSFAVAAYIVYYLLPKIGGRARNKKMAEMLKTTLNAYFGDENSDTNVLAINRSLAKAQELFMNDSSNILEDIKKSVAPLAALVEEFKNSENARQALTQLSVAVESAVELMASQLNDLVLASPSISAKKKEEIERAWTDKVKEIHASMETAVTCYDGEDEK